MYFDQRKKVVNMIAIFTIILIVIAFTIIISIISKSKKEVRELGKHFADNKDSEADSNSNETSKKSYYDNVKSAHEEDELKRKKLREQLGLFDKSIYDDLFSSGVRERGEVYFKEDRISNFTQDNNKYTCNVNGTSQYDVTLTFSDENPDEIKEASCTCPYYTREHKYCKHIYSLLYKIKCSENQNKIDNKFAEIASETSDMINNTAKDINENFSNYNKNVVEQFVKYTKPMLERITDMVNYYTKLKTENAKLNQLNYLIKTTNEIKERIQNYNDRIKDPDFDFEDYDEDFDDDFDDDDFDEYEKDSKSKLLDDLAVGYMAYNHF